MESITTYMVEHGLYHPLMMGMITVSSILAGIAFYYRVTYGTVQKCRFCLSVGKHSDVKTGKECSECGEAHIRKDHWTEVDEKRLADYKANYYIEKEHRKQQEEQEALNRKRKEEAAFLERKLVAQQEAAEKKKLEADAEAERQRLAAIEQSKIDALREEENALLEKVYAGQVVRVLKNDVKARHPNDDRYLAPGDLIQVERVAFNSERKVTHKGTVIAGRQQVFYRRYQGKTSNHVLPLIHVEPTGNEEFLPGRFARVKSVTANHPHITDPTKSLEVDTIIRIAGCDENGVSYKTCRGMGHINPSRLQLVIDPVDCIEPGDVVKVVRNDVKAHDPSTSLSKHIQAGNTVVVNSVQRKGTDGWPNKQMDVITYAYAKSQAGLNFLPLYDVVLVEKHYDSKVESSNKTASISVPITGTNYSYLDKWLRLNDTDIVGLCKGITTDGKLRVAYYDGLGALQESLWPVERVERCTGMGLSQFDKFTKEWTEKFFIPRLKKGTNEQHRPNIDALLPSAMQEYCRKRGWEPRTTGEARDLEASVRKELESIYANQNS